MKASLSPELERLILERVSSGRYRSADEVVRRSLKLLQKDEENEAAGPVSRSANLADTFVGIAAEVPDSEWQKVPADLSQHLDHYLYKTQKTS